MEEVDMSRIEKTLKKLVITQLVCLVCGKFIFTPIKECTEGHCFCKQCAGKISKCPCCWSKMADSRPFDLENIQNTLTIPCKNDWQGCTFVGVGTETEKHEITCPKSHVKCPVNLLDCQWVGPSSTFYSHGKKCHDSNFFNIPSQKFVAYNFSELMDRRYYIIFKVYNNLFRFTWGVHLDTKEVRFAVYYMEKVNLAAPIWCTYEINIFKNCKPTIKLKAPCYHLERDVMFQKEKYLTVPYDMIKELCDEDGDLLYEVKLICGEFMKQHIK